MTTAPRGGKRPGAGRPKCSSNPNGHKHTLAQRYTVSEMHDINTEFATSGCKNISEFIREIVTGHCWQPTRGGDKS